MNGLKPADYFLQFAVDPDTGEPLHDDEPLCDDEALARELAARFRRRHPDIGWIGLYRRRPYLFTAADGISWWTDDEADTELIDDDI